jgi:NAD(P)-dependent dehydrogenase (short-subunit alcohol dehydrogenase family)
LSHRVDREDPGHTGAGSGIGAATARLLARHSAKVRIADINTPIVRDGFMRGELGADQTKMVAFHAEHYASPDTVAATASACRRVIAA